MIFMSCFMISQSTEHQLHISYLVAPILVWHMLVRTLPLKGCRVLGFFLLGCKKIFRMAPGLSSRVEVIFALEKRCGASDECDNDEGDSASDFLLMESAASISWWR